MRANHATKAPEPVRRAVGAARRPGGRWLPRPRVVAAGGALLAQLWGLGAAGAYAAAAGPLPEPVSRTVGRTLDGGPVLDGGSAGHPVDAAGQGAASHSPGPVPTGQAAARRPSADLAPADLAPAGQSGSGRAAPGRTPPGLAASPGVLGRLAEPATAAVPVPALSAAAAPVTGLLQDRIRAGDLPLPGQRASVPDAFAIASGLLAAAPVQTRSAETRASRDADTGEPAAEPGRTGGGGAPAGPSAPTATGSHGSAAPLPDHEAADRRAQAAGHSGAGGGESARTAVADRSAPHESPAVTGTAAEFTGHGLSGTGTAVLAPIAAGLLLTGAAMCKHRGLPRGH
ncbi:hypothetical protein ABT263_29505 [Kitasatospora sp. NPDC001603]|uniref:hypothetical protein n=1 Tax=Kitasatospora sp. NPDC001603 TaxID=3154388 RepID=UPI003332EE90